MENMKIKDGEIDTSRLKTYLKTVSMKELQLIADKTLMYITMNFDDEQNFEEHTKTLSANCPNPQEFLLICILFHNIFKPA